MLELVPMDTIPHHLVMTYSYLVVSEETIHSVTGMVQLEEGMGCNKDIRCMSLRALT